QRVQDFRRRYQIGGADLIVLAPFGRPPRRDSSRAGRRLSLSGSDKADPASRLGGGRRQAEERAAGGGRFAAPIVVVQYQPDGRLSTFPKNTATSTGTAQARDGFGRPGYLQGAEREIVILFGDIRAFTKFSENRLPYDLVFLLNRYF